MINFVVRSGGGGVNILICFLLKSFPWRLNYLMHAFFSYQDCYHPSTDIDPRANISPDMEKGMH
jgi:hypothetical protein